MVDGGLMLSGTYSSIRLIDNKTPVIAFYRDSATDAALAVRGSSSWSTYAIETTGDTGKYIGLALTPDAIHVAYQNGAGRLRWAWASYAAPATWKGSVIDATSASSGAGTQIEADPVGGLHVLTRRTTVSGGVTVADYWYRKAPSGGSSVSWVLGGSFDTANVSEPLGLFLDRVTLWPLASWGRSDVDNAWFGTWTCE